LGLGISIPTLTGLPLAELVTAAVAAEAAGADTVWIPESWCLDPFGVLHAAGSATSRLRLATGVAVIAGRAPAVTAMAAQTLAQAFPGRVVLGLGAGHRETVEGWLGVPYDGTVAAMREYVAVVRQVWSGQALSAAGPRWQVADFRSAASPGPPPTLFLAALGRRMQELVADAAEGAILTMATPDLVREAAGRLPGRKLAASFLAGLDAGDEERARRSIAVYGFWKPLSPASGTPRPSGRRRTRGGGLGRGPPGFLGGRRGAADGDRGCAGPAGGSSGGLRAGRDRRPRRGVPVGGRHRGRAQTPHRFRPARSPVRRRPMCCGPGSTFLTRSSRPIKNG
jgi:alkanesulfonate monooxygenase SsuD/methylene tetrahydromethanopterin reductase-like flavin-dependent oxidoreductase (luciferase family)